MRTPLWKNTFQSFENYFVESSIHGLRYLVEGKNWIEKVCWFFIVVVSLFFAGWMITTSFEENRKEPILTTIEPTSIENAPFPAITIAADDRVNPWGFVEKTFNMLSFYGVGPDKQNTKIFDDSVQLRNESKFIAKKIFALMEDKLLENCYNWSVADYRNYPYKKTPPKPPGTLKSMMKKIKELAPKLAGIFLGNYSNKAPIKEEIYENMAEVFFSTLSYHMPPFPTDIIETIVDKYTKAHDYTNHIELCKKEANACKNWLKYSYLCMYVPHEINRFPYYLLGFGTYLSYFSRIFFPSNGDPSIDFFPNPSKMSTEENSIRQLMSKVLKKMSNSSMGSSDDMSIYELVRLVHQGPDDYGSILKYHFGPIQDQFDCILPKPRKLQEAWEEYIEKNNKSLFPPCHEKNQAVDFSTCCKMSKLIQKIDLPTILKVMKFSIQPTVFYEPLEKFLKSFDTLDFLPFNNLAKFGNTATVSSTREDGENLRIFIYCVCIF